MPAFTGEAVKVTGVPAHILTAEAAMLTAGVTDEPTFIVMAVDVSDCEVTQLIEEVMIQVTTSPFMSWELSKMGVSVPALIPFTFHW